LKALRKARFVSLSYNETGEGAFCRRYTQARSEFDGLVYTDGKMLPPPSDALIDWE